MSLDRKPAATVIVPTRDRHELLADSLACLLAQDLAQAYEIVVVDDGSSPAVSPCAGVRLIRHDTPRGPNAARNTGARAASSELLVFVDDDIDAPPNWLREVLEGAGRHPDAQCFTGRVLLRFEGKRPRLCDRISYTEQGESEVDLGSTDVRADWACSANLAVRRRAFETVGEFLEEHPIYGDEIEWVARLHRCGLR